MKKAKKKEGKLTAEGLERVAGLFRVLGEAGRLTLLQELKVGERSVNELVECSGMSQAAVSRQLKSLHEAGVLSRRKEGTKVYYAVADVMIYELCELVCGKLMKDQKTRQEIEYMI
ncbi:MAG: ArsR/SmtB family transcription factor [Verrucomicrobiaceae bacterium]